MNPAFRALFEPLTLPKGDIAVRSRLVLAPMTTYSSNDDGTITTAELDFLNRRSRGTGITVTAACYVSSDGKAFTGQWGCHNDDMIPSLRSAAMAIKSAGALAVLQLHHGGRMSPPALLGHQSVSASDVPAWTNGAHAPRPMTEAEIEATIKAFGQATRRAIQAGFDGVELHGANMYLLQQFFSPHSNRRTDMWGGARENRAAFPLAVLEEVQEVVRRNAYRPFAIGYRLSPEEPSDPGITLDDTLELVEGIVACRVDWIHVSTWDYFAGSLRNPADTRPRTSVIARQVAGRTAVIGVGAVTTPASAVRLLDEGCQMVAIARQMVIDPEWTKKVLEGGEDRILACLPLHGADADLSIPTAMYTVIRSRPGWFPTCPENGNGNGAEAQAATARPLPKTSVVHRY